MQRNRFWKIYHFWKFRPESYFLFCKVGHKTAELYDFWFGYRSFAFQISISATNSPSRMETPQVLLWTGSSSFNRVKELTFLAASGALRAPGGAYVFHLVQNLHVVTSSESGGVVLTKGWKLTFQDIWQVLVPSLQFFFNIDLKNEQQCRRFDKSVVCIWDSVGWNLFVSAL